MKQLNRRELLGAAGAAAAAACLCTLCDTANLLAADAPATQPAASLDVGELTGFDKDGIYDKFTPAPNKIILIRNKGKLYAMTAVCTHQGGIVGKAPTPTPTAPLRCPRHGATYDLDGNVTKGPAKNPLIRYAISVDANKHVVVDTTKKFQPDQWTTDGSFITIPAAST